MRTATVISAPPTLLIADDDPAVLAIVRRLAGRGGFDVITCSNGREAVERIRDANVDMALLDLNMPELTGLEVLRTIRASDSPCEVVLMSGDPTLESAVAAVKMGALDYLQKPLDLKRVEAILSGHREDTDRRKTLLTADADLAKQLELCGMIGRSRVMQDLFTLIKRLAPHVRAALITGETGTGKELIAQALHRLGPRRSRRFVAINCSAVVETLFESELFGHVRGAFTGASEHKSGLFELADGGTLFLDEIGELPISLQAKLLRVLEQGQIQRVGALEPRAVDVQVLAATNRDLLKEADAGRFRQDLYYRLNVVELSVPPLRDRREDIPYLVASFVREWAQKHKKPIAGLTPGAEHILFHADWNGNVRELRNVVERACILAEGDILRETDVLPANSRPAPTPTLSADRASERAPSVVRRSSESGGPTDSPELSEVERNHIMQVLQSTGGNKAKAARVLGVSRRALYRRLERWDMYGNGQKPTTGAEDPEG